MSSLATEPSTGGNLPGAYVTENGKGEAPIIVTGSREQIFHLLAEAAEIEHCLMCSYLYAAFSLKRVEGPGVSAEQLAAVGQWRNTILGIATEEMGHLLILANLATAIGGKPHFARPNFPIAAGYFPSGVVVRLAGFSVETIEHFIYLERPKGVERDDAESYAQEDYSRQQVHLGLMPNAQHYSTIGYLYEAIRENLTGFVDRFGENILFIGGAGGQLAAPIVDMPGVAPIADLQSALAGIDIIVEQGEGSPEDRDGTHYRSFLKIMDQYRRMTEEDRAFEPAWPVAESPVLRSPPEPDGKVFVDHPSSAPVLDAACAAYGLLLRLLAQCFGDEAAAPERQQKLFSVALELMHILAECGCTLAELPARADTPDIHAGMSFTMLRGVEPLRSGRIGEHLLAEELERFVQGAAQVGPIGHLVRDRLAALTL